jgi:hypothetical protein
MQEVLGMQQTIQEAPRSTPVLAQTDVLVAGGGLSGVIAALAAARHGASVILVERFSCLGGVAALGLPIQGFCCDTGEQIIKGIPEEWRQRLTRNGGAVDHFTKCKMHNPFLVVSPEGVKYTCQEMLIEAGVQILLDALVVDVVGTCDRIEAVIIESKSGRQAIVAKQFIDCTGDADLVASIGAPFSMASDDALQANTLSIIMTGVDKRRLQEFIKNDPDNFDLYPMLPREQIGNADYYIMAGLSNIVRKAEKDKRFAGLYGMTNFHTMTDDDTVHVNSVHVSGRNSCDLLGVTQMELDARKQAQMVVKFMQEYIPGFENAKLTATGPWLGIRESRIIEGLDTLTLDDIKGGRIPNTTICLGGYPYDFHQKDDKDAKIQFYKVPPYGITYGMLIPRGTNNLFVAGKTISATREAMCSSRVMAQCMGEGQAVGTAAVLCLQEKTNSTSLSIDKLRQVLVSDGVKLE